MSLTYDDQRQDEIVRFLLDMKGGRQPKPTGNVEEDLAAKVKYALN